MRNYKRSQRPTLPKNVKTSDPCRPTAGAQSVDAAFGFALNSRLHFVNLSVDLPREDDNHDLRFLAIR